MISEVAVSDSLAAPRRQGTVGVPAGKFLGRTLGGLAARRAWLAMAGVTGVTAVIVLFARGSYMLLPQSTRPIPATLAGAFANYGVDLDLAAIIPLLAVMLICYGVAVHAAHQLSARAVVTVTVLALALILLGPPLISTDVFSYTAYGRIGALYGVNPYVHGPVSIALDPLFPFVGAQWVDTPTAYGPLFTALSYLLGPLDIAANVLAYKAMAVVSTLAILTLVWACARLRGLDPVRPMALVGLNPLILIYAVGGGHNDLLMMAILLGGVYAVLRSRDRTSGALVVTAVAVKLTAGLMLPFALASTWSERGGIERRRAVIAGAAVAAGLGAALSFAVFGTGPLHLVQTLATVQSQGGSHSFSGLLLKWADVEHPSPFIAIGPDLAFVVWLVWLVRRVAHGRIDWITGAGWATLALLVTSSFLLPWYVAWLIPLAALSKDRRLLVTTFVMTAVGMTML